MLAAAGCSPPGIIQRRSVQQRAARYSPLATPVPRSGRLQPRRGDSLRVEARLGDLFSAVGGSIGRLYRTLGVLGPFDGSGSDTDGLNEEPSVQLRGLSSASPTPGAPGSRPEANGGPADSDSKRSRISRERWQAKGSEVVRAYRNNSLGFGFSAGGLLFPYYVGVLDALEQEGVLKGKAQMAGASAGSLIAASYNSGLSMATVEESMIRFGEDCLKNGTRNRLGPLLRAFLEEYLPQDAHKRCSGSTHVAITRIVPYWRAWLVSDFHSREDLIDALMASCHIPWYFNGNWVTRFRARLVADGGLMSFTPSVPRIDYCVKVCCFPTWSLERVRSYAGHRLQVIDQMLDMDISPDTFEPWPYGAQQVLKWALQASTRETSSFLIEKGRRDARAWLVETGLDKVLEEERQQQEVEAQQREERAATPKEAEREAEREAVVVGAAGEGGKGPKEGAVQGPTTETEPMHQAPPAA